MAVGEFTLQECTHMVVSNNAASPMGTLIWVAVMACIALAVRKFSRWDFEKSKRKAAEYDPRTGLEPWE